MGEVAGLPGRRPDAAVADDRAGSSGAELEPGCYTLQGHSRTVNSLAMSLDGELLVSGKGGGGEGADGGCRREGKGEGEAGCRGGGEGGEEGGHHGMTA